MNNNEKLATLVIGLLLAVFGIIMLNIGKQEQIKQLHQAYSVCLTAHAEVSGKSETACGNAQDATHTEFLCNNNGQYCWLEVK